MNRLADAEWWDSFWGVGLSVLLIIVIAAIMHFVVGFLTGHAVLPPERGRADLSALALPKTHLMAWNR